MADEKFITLQGKKDLEKELVELNLEMEEIIKKIKEAREFGDLSENAEYDAAKTEQAQVGAKIMEIEAILRNAKIIDDTKLSKDIVQLGSTVTILDMHTNKESTYKLVGTTEADPEKKKISDVSPLGKALMGAAKNKEVVVKCPHDKTYTVRIIKIN